MGNLVEQVGPAPKDSQWIHVFDRGGDYFEAMCRIQRTKNDWVIRASKLNRNVLDCSGKKLKLSEAVEEATELGTFTISLRITLKHSARTAKLSLSYCEITFLAPNHKSPWLKQSKLKQLPMFVVF